MRKNTSDQIKKNTSDQPRKSDDRMLSLPFHSHGDAIDLWSTRDEKENIH